MADAPARTFRVEGMSCEHCVAAVRGEVGAIPGVDAVEVDLDSARLTVEGEVSEDQVREAVEEAGYALAG